jgi:hypothetical protein
VWSSAAEKIATTFAQAIARDGISSVVGPLIAGPNGDTVAPPSPLLTPESGIGNHAQAALFTGDCLFCGGCGAMFECNGPQDVLTTHGQLRRLLDAPDAAATVVFVGHEYSRRLFSELADRANTATAKKTASLVEPGHPTRRAQIPEHSSIFKERLRMIEVATSQHLATVPSTLALEAQTNPLMTLDVNVLERMLREFGPHNIETAIYTSKERRVVLANAAPRPVPASSATQLR